MNAKYKHQNYADAAIRSTARINKMNELPKEMYDSLLIQVDIQIKLFNETVAANDTSQILNQINMLYEMINQNASLPDDLFSNDVFINNLSVIISNPPLCIATCKLMSRILYYTKSIGVKLSNLLLPSIQLFAQNAMLPESEVIMTFLCNLSSDLQLYVKLPRSSNEKHPLENVVIGFASIQNALIQRPFTESTLLFIRHISNFAFPTEIDSFQLIINFLKSLTTTEQIFTNAYFMDIVLWTLYDICEKRGELAEKIIVQDDFIAFLVHLIQKDNNRFAEPILGIFFQVINIWDISESSGTDTPEIDFNLPYIYHLCLTTTDATQYEALQFLHGMTKIFPIFMYQNNVKDLIFKAIDIDCSYKAKFQVLWIACLLLSCRSVDHIDAQSVHELLAFVVSHVEASDDETREILAIHSIQYLKLSFQIMGKSDEFEQLMMTTGAMELIESLRESQNEAILAAISNFDETTNFDLAQMLQMFDQDSYFQDLYEEFDPKKDPLEHKAPGNVSIRFVYGGK